MAEVRMTMAEYLELINGLSSEPAVMPIAEETKPKRKTSAYQRRYKANFRRIEKDFKLKNGMWKKNGFKRCVKEAHRLSKKK